MTPLECYIQIDPDSGSPSNTAVLGETQPKNTSARLIAYPPVKAKDLIVEAENKRWKVITVSGTERLRSVVRQELSLHLIPRGDTEFKVPINLSDLKRQWAATRNFTNPQHVDDDSYKLSEKLNVYDDGPKEGPE